MIPRSANDEDAAVETRWLEALDELVSAGLLQMAEQQDSPNAFFRGFQVTDAGYEWTAPD